MQNPENKMEVYPFIIQLEDCDNDENSTDSTDDHERKTSYTVCPILTICIRYRQINFNDGTFLSIGQLLFTVGQYFVDGKMSCNAGSAYNTIFIALLSRWFPS